MFVNLNDILYHIRILPFIYLMNYLFINLETFTEYFLN